MKLDVWMQVQVLLAELAMVEEEIIWLERKVDKLKLSLYHEKKQTREWQPPKVRRRPRQLKQLSFARSNQMEVSCRRVSLKPQGLEEDNKNTILRERRASFSSSMKSNGTKFFPISTQIAVNTTKYTNINGFL